MQYNFILSFEKKRLIKLICFFLSISYTSSFSFAGKENIARLFQRVLTYGQEALYPLDLSHRNAFLTRNFLNYLNFRNPMPHLFDEPNGSPHQQLHAALYRRLTKSTKQGRSQPIPLLLENKRPDANSQEDLPSVGLVKYSRKLYDLSSDNSLTLHRGMLKVKKDFIEGHFIHMAGITSVPFIGTHMRAAYNDRPITYILPIEFAHGCLTVGQYREEACLLKP
jgi:hypothetical protein